jgi:hypothetical protein
MTPSQLLPKPVSSCQYASLQLGGKRDSRATGIVQTSSAEGASFLVKIGIELRKLRSKRDRL